jgi:hypothetical protein
MKHKLELSEDDINIIGKALVQMPYHMVADLIFRINQSINEGSLSGEGKDGSE